MSNAIRPIRSQQDYEAALARIDGLMNAEQDTPEADELEVLAILVELYEKEFTEGGLKIYHRTSRRLGADKQVDYLTLASSLEAARAVLVAHICSHARVAPEFQEDAALIASADPIFVAGENYPVVIWKG